MSTTLFFIGVGILLSTALAFILLQAWIMLSDEKIK